MTRFLLSLHFKKPIRDSANSPIIQQAPVKDASGIGQYFFPKELLYITTAFTFSTSICDHH